MKRRSTLYLASNCILVDIYDPFCLTTRLNLDEHWSIDTPILRTKSETKKQMNKCMAEI